jgi:hypothetical protein
MLNNSTEDPTKHPQLFGYYSLFITLFFLVPAFVFNILLLVSIVMEKTIPAAIRFILANILAASEIVIIGIAIILLQNVILSGLTHLESSIVVCQVTYVSLASGAAARLFFMANFAVSVYVLVRRGASRLKLVPSLVAGLLLWLFAIVPNTVLFSSDFLDITFHDSSACAPHGRNVTTPIYTFSYIAIYGCCSFIVGIVFPILTICYIKKNTISGNSQMLRGMVKFAIFLLIGNSMNFMGISIPILFATFAPSGEEYYILEKAFNYAEGILLMLSLIPTPVILLVFFKPIRHRLLEMVCFICVNSKARKDKTVPTSHTPGTAQDTV